MPFDSNGTASLVPSYFVRDGDTILPSQHNPVLEDIRSMLSNVVVRDGRAPLTGPLNANGNKITGVVDGTDPTDVASVGQAAAVIGDFKDTVRTLDGKWLRRNGALYNSVDYPTLAALLPALPDGVEWNNRVSGTTNEIRGFMFDGTRFWAVAGTDIRSSSDGGQTWLLRYTATGASLSGITFGSGIYVVSDIANGKIYTSLDGDAWSDQGVKNAAGVFDVVWAPALNLFVGVGGLLGGVGWIGTSPEGTTWTTRASGVATALSRVKYFAGTLLAVGGVISSNGVIITSTNGTTWTARTSNVNGALQDAAFDGTTYIVAGNGGVISSSTNLTGWTPRTSGVVTALNVTLASSSGFLVAGANGVVRISGNVSSWSPSATGLTGTWRAGIVDPGNPAHYLLGGPSQTVFDGLRTLPTQFRVPNDKADYGWIRAL